MRRDSLGVALGDVVEVVIEVSRFSFVKRRPDGRVHFISPVPTLFNYGSIVGTLGPDGDPIDALLMGPRVARGTRHRERVVAVVDFVDHDLADPKYVLCSSPLSRRERATLEIFFRVYAGAKVVLDPGPGRTAFRGWLA